MVAPVGLEPTRPHQAVDFESTASTIPPGGQQANEVRPAGIFYSFRPFAPLEIFLKRAKA